MKMKPSIPKGCGSRQKRGERKGNHHQDDLLKNHQTNFNDNRCVVAICESRLVHLLRGWFPYKLANPESRIKQKSSASRSHEWKAFTSS